MFLLQFLTPLVVIKYMPIAVVHLGDSDSTRLRYDSTLFAKTCDTV